MIGKGIFLRPLPQLHLRAVEIAHHPGACGGHGDEHVVLAAVDLLAVLVVGVDRARQHLVGTAVHRRGIDAERAVGQALREACIGLASAVVHRRQLRERPAVVVQLGLLLLVRLREAARAREEAVEVVEAAVLGVDDDDGLDLLEAGRRSVGATSGKNCA